MIVNGPPVTAVTDRVAGFLEEIKKHPDLKFCPRTKTQAEAAMEACGS